MATRSLLYVPGDRPERFDKAGASGADGIILDLEDAVAPGAKAAARESVATWLGSTDAVAAGISVWVRVNNHPDLLADDIAAFKGAPITGIAVPKTESAATLAQVLELAGRDDLLLAPLLETAAGVLDVVAIAAAPQVSHLMIGEADLGAELGISDPDGFWPIRTQVVIASAAAGIASPVGPVSTQFRDLDALRESSGVLARRGFGGRSCIHPDQVAVVNEVFSPSAQDIEWATDVVTRFEASDSGICIDAGGRMIDEAVVRAARRILARA